MNTPKKDNVRQHFVQRNYLKRFGDGKGLLTVYDIKEDRIYKSSVANQCVINSFYNIDLEYLSLFTDKPVTAQQVDERIRELNEFDSSNVLESIDKVKFIDKNFQFDRKEREALYNFIILQIIRTPRYGSRLHYLNLPFSIKAGLSGELGDGKTLDIVHNLLIYGVLQKMYNVDFGLNKKYQSIFGHLIEEILDLRRQLRNAGKIFLVSKIDDSFITTSTPVNVLWKSNPLAHAKALITPMNPDKPLFDIGEFLEIQTVFLPISSEVGLFLFDKRLNSSLLCMNQSVGFITEKNRSLLTNLNLSSMLKNRHKVYSKNQNIQKVLDLYHSGKWPVMRFEFE